MGSCRLISAEYSAPICTSCSVETPQAPVIMALPATSPIIARPRNHCLICVIVPRAPSSSRLLPKEQAPFHGGTDAEQGRNQAFTRTCTREGQGGERAVP